MPDEWQQSFTKFLLLTFLVGCICLVVSILLWLVLFVSANFTNWVLANNIACLGCLTAALIIIMLMILFSGFDANPKINTVLAVIVVLLLIFGSLMIVARANIIQFIVAIAIALLVTLFCILCAIFCQCDFTIYIIHLLILLLVCFLTLFLFLIAFFTQDSRQVYIMQMFLMSYLIFTVIILMIFTCQALQGGYFIEVEQCSVLKSGCCFFVHIVVLFLMILTFALVIKNRIKNGNRTTQK